MNDEWSTENLLQTLMLLEADDFVWPKSFFLKRPFKIMNRIWDSILKKKKKLTTDQGHTTLPKAKLCFFQETIKESGNRTENSSAQQILGQCIISVRNDYLTYIIFLQTPY